MVPCRRMRFSFRSRAKSDRKLRIPAPASFPAMLTAELAMTYRPARVGGDFFDSLIAPNSRLVFALLDIAGKREEALHLAAHVQETFRRRVTKLFAADDVNEADSVTDLSHTLNKSLLDAAGKPCCSPAFIASYSPDIGTLMYLNAGHMPGFVADKDGVVTLASNGVPLGLFSHIVNDAQLCVLHDDAAFVIASRGVIECQREREEFGPEGVRSTLAHAARDSAQQLCRTVLEAALGHCRNKPPHNDLTALALLRRAQHAQARSKSRTMVAR